MYRLECVSSRPVADLESELRSFFGRVRALRRTLSVTDTGLNRLQRMRCRENLRALERLERELYAVTYKEDIYTLYRYVQSLVKLDMPLLTQKLGHETVVCRSLFII